MDEKINRVFAILIEPANYTIDRNRCVYDEIGVDYCYIKSFSLASSGEVESDMCIGKYSLLKKIFFLNNILKKYDAIIMNGYVHIEFIILFILNFYYRKNIGIDSDTQYSLPPNFLIKNCKSIYLNMIFRNRNIYGLPGGTKSHYDLFYRFGMKEERIFLMPMVIDVAKFNPLLFKKKAKDAFRFLYVGRIVKSKNIEMMLECFIDCLKQRKQLELVLVGEGELMEKLSCKYSMYHNIVFKGKLFNKELVNEYHNADAFILPSIYEPWGLVVNEAMATALPVIVSNQVGAAYDLVEGRNTGFIFDVNSKDMLINAMVEMGADEKVYQKMSTNAYDLLHKYWNFSLYKECLNNFINKAVYGNL